MSKQTGQDLTLRFGGVIASYWITNAILAAFASAYLLNIGFTNTMIGTMLAASGLGASILQPAVSSYADEPKSPSLPVLLGLLGIVSMTVLCGALPFSGMICGYFYIAALTILQIPQPLMNALGMAAISQGKTLHFGSSRAMGSVAYAVTAVGMGFLCARLGSGIIPISGLATILLFIWISRTFPMGKTRTVSETSGVSAAAFVRKYPRFIGVLAGYALIYTSHIIVNNFTLQILQAKGGGTSEMGIATALGALAEIPAMLAFARLNRRFRCDSMLRFSGIFFVIKALGSLLAPTVHWYYAVQMLQLPAWGLTTVGLVCYVDRNMQPEDAVKGQGYATASYTISGIIGTLAGGRLLDSAGVSGLLLFGTIVSAVGALIVLFCAERTE